MKALRLSIAVPVTLAGALGIAFAQDHSMEGHDMAAMELPKACQTGKAPEMPSMENMDGMGEHQKAFMQGMMKTEGPMMQGMMAEVADIAFLCAMIPHHQGAIEMAKVELQYGDNDASKAMAQKIIDAQEQEIAEMTKMIEEQSQ